MTASRLEEVKAELSNVIKQAAESYVDIPDVILTSLDNDPSDRVIELVHNYCVLRKAYLQKVIDRTASYPSSDSPYSTYLSNLYYWAEKTLEYRLTDILDVHVFAEIVRAAYVLDCGLWHKELEWVKNIVNASSNICYGEVVDEKSIQLMFDTKREAALKRLKELTALITGCNRLVYLDQYSKHLD